METFDISSDDSSDEGDSHYDSPRGGHPLVDLEAAASSDEDEESEQDFEEDSEVDSEYSTFHPFVHLPPELRRRVWDFFCADIILKARCLSFDMNWAPMALCVDLPQRDKKAMCPTDSMTLEDETWHLRCMMAVHQESRCIGLKFAPDALNLKGIGSGDAIIRFHKQRDVVMLQHFLAHATDVTYLLSEFGKDITQLAISVPTGLLNTMPERLRYRMPHFPNVKRLFFYENGLERKQRQLAWCGSDLICRYSQRMFEKEVGVGEDVEWMICWPDVDNHDTYAKYEIAKMCPLRIPADWELAIREAGIEPWPMIYFDSDRLMRQYDKALSQAGIPYGDDSSDSSDSASSGSGSENEGGTDQNEYESDGLDDSEVVDEYVSEDEEVPAAISVGSSPAGGADLQGHFSSPEPEDDDNQVAVTKARRLKRRVVSDSDDDSVVEEPRAKRARTGRAVMIDSDDDEDGAEQATASQKSHIVISDSDSGGDDAEQSGRQRRRTNGRVQDSESSSEESDEDDVQNTRQITLAERLQRQPRAQVISDDDDSGGEDVAVDISDDNEDDDEDEDEDDSGDGLIDGMAAESDDEGDEGSDEGW